MWVICVYFEGWAIAFSVHLEHFKAMVNIYMHDTVKIYTIWLK